MRYEKIHAAIKFLETDSDGNQTDLLNYGAMVLKRALKCAEEAHKKNADTKSQFLSVTTPLLKLAYKAESGNKREAANACIKLAGLYLEIEKHKDIDVPYNSEIARGFLARAHSLMNENSYNTAIDTIKKKMHSEEPDEIDKILNSDAVRENSNKKTADLLELIKSHVEGNQSYEASVKKRLDSIEKNLPDSVYRLYSQLDRTSDRFAGKRRRSRWIRRIIVVLILLLMIPGYLMGPGEGIQGLFYFLFLIPNTLHVFDAYEITSFADYMKAMPGDDERTTMFGILLAVIPLLNLVLSVILYFLSSFKEELLFAKQKQALSEEHRIDDAVNEAGKIEDCSTNGGEKEERRRIVALGVYNSYCIWDELAVFYHAHRFCKTPDSVYATWRARHEVSYVSEPSTSSGGPSLYERYERSKYNSDSSSDSWMWRNDVEVSDNWGNTKTMSASMAHSLGYMDNDDYLKYVNEKTTEEALDYLSRMKDN